jgi:energy-converting hydrogenase A subunit R
LKRIFVSDCEGPISKNDNAFELAAHFIPEGGNLFTAISKYDDVLADLVKRPGYSAGGTLKLILPFLLAYKVTDEQMHEFSAQNLLLIANSKETLRHILALTDAFIVSTSYEHYIGALCEAICFPFENAYCTRVKIDNYSLSDSEVETLKQIVREIVSMPYIVIPFGARGLKDLSSSDQETVKRLDAIFWSQIAKMSCGRIFSEVVTVGGEQKAEAIRDAVGKLNASLGDVMYVGDSITDVEAFKLVSSNGGMAVSFNGNAYAVNSAEVVVLSESNSVTALIFDVFFRFGKTAVLDLVKNWGKEALERSFADPGLVTKMLVLCSKDLPKVQIAQSANMETLVVESNAFRKKVRGEAVGRLG